MKVKRRTSLIVGVIILVVGVGFVLQYFGIINVPIAGLSLI